MFLKRVAVSTRHVRAKSTLTPRDPRDSFDFDLYLGFAIGFFMGISIKRTN